MALKKQRVQPSCIRLSLKKKQPPRNCDYWDLESPLLSINLQTEDLEELLSEPNFQQAPLRQRLSIIIITGCARPLIQATLNFRGSMLEAEKPEATNSAR